MDKIRLVYWWATCMIEGHLPKRGPNPHDHMRLNRLVRRLRGRGD